MASFFFIVPTIYGQEIPFSFIQDQTHNYRHWLHSTRLDQYMEIDTVVIEGAALTMYINAKGKKNWARLSRYVDSAFHSDLMADMYDRYLFLFDLPKDSAKVVVNAGDQTFCIHGSLSGLQRDTLVPMGSTKKFPDVDILWLSSELTPGWFKSTRSARELRDTLKKFFFNFFKPYNANSGPFRFDDISQSYDELKLDIGNIKKAVIQENFYEHLDLNFDFIKDANSTIIHFTFEGKFASGEFWTPHDERYQPIEDEYPSEFDHFYQVLKHDIFTIVN
jgi:hypothetical protein